MTRRLAWMFYYNKCELCVHVLRHVRLSLVHIQLRVIRTSSETVRTNELLLTSLSSLGRDNFFENGKFMI